MDRKILLVMIALTGCASSKSIYLPNGQQGFAIKCGGSAMSWSGCFERAGRLCGASGYTIIDRQGETSTSIVASQYGLAGGDIVRRTLMIACN